MSDTFFTAAPHWGWYIVFYFFIGGIAGGAFFLGSLLRLFGRPEDAPAARLAAWVALIGAVVSGLLLTLDLTRPERFWHMLIQSHTGLPMFKAWAPMSIGSWALLLFSGFAFLVVIQAMVEEDRIRWRPARLLTRRGPSLGLALLGSLLGLFLAGYTGVLLAVSNRPIWADSPLLGLLFLVSGVSTAAATLILLSGRLDRGHAGLFDWLSGFDRRALLLELVVLVAFLVSLGPVIRALINGWGVLLLVGTVGAGIFAPLVLESRRERRQAAEHLAAAAGLVLVGGLVLRIVVILSSEQIELARAMAAAP